MNFVIGAEEGDTLVATSSPALAATTELLEIAHERLEATCGDRPKYVRSRQKVIKIPLAIEDQFCDSCDRLLARKLLEVPSESLIVLCFGRMSREYKADLACMFMAIRSLRLSFPKVELWIAGSTVHVTSADYIERLALEYEVASCLRIVRNVSPAQKKLIYSSSDVFVSPSDNINESFGLSVLEAMGSRLPVVASNWSGYRDLVVDAESGFLVDTFIWDDTWRDASILAEWASTPQAEFSLAQGTIVDVSQLTARLRTLLSDADLRARMGDCGHRHVRQNFVWSKIINRFRDAWHEAVEISCSNRKKNDLRLHLKRVFSGYPSRVFGNQTLFVYPLAGVDEALLARSRVDQSTMALWQECAARPVLLSALMQRGNSVRVRLVWLVKRGLLGLHASPRPG